MKTLEEEIIETLALANAKIKSLAQQNKELREELGAANSAIYSLQENLTYAVKTKELENEGWKVMAKAQEAEIQRLTKEVEQLRLKVEKWVFSGVALHAKNTRLRELLRICKEELKEYSPDYLDDLFSNIDNALNHKP